MTVRNTARGIAATLLLVCCSIQAVFAECVEPTPLVVPDGAQADQKEMLAAYRDLRSYQEVAQAYLDCLDTLKVSAPTEDVEVMLERLNAYNRTVDNMDRVNREVHQQLDIFNAR